MCDWHELERSLGYFFTNTSLLKQALTHPSYTAERKNVDYDNQRLEFLGDAVLQLVSSDLLYNRYPEAREGRLSKMRSLIAREEGLAHFARHIGLGSFVRLGRGDKINNGHDRDSTLADAMEAVFGAVYLDGGFDAVQNMIVSLVQDLIIDIEKNTGLINPKGELQEKCQDIFKVLPEYTVLDVTGPEHAPQYEVRVSVNGRELATGRGGNRREAEKEAARHGLHFLCNNEAEEIS